MLADVARGLGAHAGTAFDHGSQNVTGTTALLARPRSSRSPRSPPRCCWRAARGAPTPIRRSRCSAALAVLVALAPGALAAVPAVARAALGLLAPRYPLQAVLLALASVLTRVELRFAFDDLPRFDWGAIALVALRNAVLVARSRSRSGEPATGRASGRPPRPA